MARGRNTAVETQVENTEAIVETENTEATSEVEQAEVYKFTSENKYLTCVALGVQFVNGYASTTNLAVARALTKIEGVSLVED